MLSSLTAGALEDAAERRKIISYGSLESLIETAPPVANVYEQLAPTDHIKVIAEVKRASPSRGKLAEIENPASLALTYEQHGASVISVLTEQRKFMGSLEDLRAVKEKVSVPVLRKDFIAEEYQILEARAFGADVILLIVAALEQHVLERLYKFADELGLGILIETHSLEELHRSLELNPQLLGINARDLSTFELDRNLFSELSEFIPSGVIKVAESAVRNTEDVQHYRNSGADVVLVGEALVTSDAAQTLSSFLAVR